MNKIALQILATGNRYRQLKRTIFGPMRQLLVLSFILFSLGMQAQKPSQIMMMNGRTYDVKLKQLALPTIQFEWNKNHKIYNPAPDKVFSVTDSVGKKTFVYYQDSLLGNELNVRQMENFLFGYNDARHYRYGGDFAIGFASGMGGSFLGAIYGWGVPIIATTINVTIKPRVSQRVIGYHPGLAFDSSYLAGARRKIRNRKMFGTMFGGAAGMVVGTILFQFIVRNPLTD